MKQKIKNIIPYVIFGTFITFFLLYSAGTFVSATGLFDETIDTSNLYSKYGLENYQLDFFVDNSWGWLPWNWTDSIGKTITYGFYAITNLIWILSLYICNATGYVVQEAFKFDFVNIIADEIAKGMQGIFGVNTSGVTNDGLLAGALPLLILVMGIYLMWTGIIKRETTKSINAVLRFFMVFIVSVGFVMYSSTYIKYINEFSSELGTAVLSVSSKVNLDDENTSNKDSVDLIRDNLFTVQVYKPWVILQYGNGNIDEVGKKRVESLLSTNPNANKGEDREKIVKEEIEEKDNGYLTVTKVYVRFGMVLFLLVVNIGISVFVLLLSAIKIFTQIQFIFYAMFMPVSAIMSMIPNSKNMMNKTFLKLFNIIMLNAGVIMVITIGFTISNLIYNVTDELPFIMVMFLQVVVFAGIYMKLNDLLDMVSLKVSDGQSAVRKFIQNPARKMKREYKKVQRKMGIHNNSKARTLSKKAKTTSRPSTASTNSRSRENIMNDIEDVKENAQKVATGTTLKSNQNSSDLRDNVTYKSQKLGEKVGAITDIKSATKDKVDTVIDNVKNMPTNVKYGIHQKKRDIKDSVKQSVSSFKDGMNEAKQKKVQARENVAYQRKNEMQQKQDVLQKEKERKQRIQNRQKARELREQAGVKEQVIKPVYTVGEDGKIQSYINKVYAKDDVKDKIKQKRLSKTQYRNPQNVKQPMW